MSLIQFSFWKYSLRPKHRVGAMSSSQPREGALFRIKWPYEFQGYADCFPWPELGDLTLDEQIQGLKAGRISKLFEQTMWLARRDAVARSGSLNLMKNQMRVRNHFLISNPEAASDATLTAAQKAGYTSAKLKCGVNLDQEIEIANRLLRVHRFSIRLDFNSRSTPAELNHFINTLPQGLRSKIEYVEDPFPYDPALWAAANQLVPLALDLEEDRVDWSKISGPAPFKVLILKPSRQDVAASMERIHKHRLKFVITSSLDHPVGQLHAAALGSEFKRLYPNTILDGGCFSHNEYEPDIFSRQLPAMGPFFNELPGHGIGFDETLKSLPWLNIREV